MNDADDRPGEIDTRLARDAAGWGGEPCAAARKALRARLAVLPAARRPAAHRHLVLLAAAAAILAVLMHGRAAPDPAPATAARNESSRWSASALAAGATDRALSPLRSEIAALSNDAEGLARGIWAQVPAPLRRLAQ